MTNGNDSMTNDPMTNDLMPTSSLLSPQSCSFISQPSSLAPHHLFADVCVELLNLGQGVRFKANGWSMYPTICDGEIINVEPVLPYQVRHGDIILYRSPRGITAHRVVHIQKEMEPHGQASDPIQPPMWGDISRLTSGQAVLRRRSSSPFGANSVLSPQSSSITGNSLLGYWVTGLLGSRDSVLSPKSPSLDPRHSSLIFYTRGDSLKAVDPPLTSDQILGKVFSVERNGRTVALYGNRAFMLQEMRLFLFQLKQSVVYVIRGIKAFFPKRRVSFKVNGAKTQ